MADMIPRLLYFITGAWVGFGLYGLLTTKTPCDDCCDCFDCTQDFDPSDDEEENN